MSKANENVSRNAAFRAFNDHRHDDLCLFDQNFPSGNHISDSEQRDTRRVRNASSTRCLMPHLNICLGSEYDEEPAIVKQNYDKLLAKLAGRALARAQVKHEAEEVMRRWSPAGS